MTNFNPNNSNFLKGVTESYFADLGRVIAAWSHVENQFLLLYLSVVAMKNTSGSLSDPNVKKLMGLPFKKQLELFRARLKELDIPDSSVMTTMRILDRLGLLRTQRDEVAHSVITPSIEQVHNGQVFFAQGESTALIKSWKNSKQPECRQLSQTHLKGLFEKIHILYWDLVELSIDTKLWCPREL